MSKAQFHIRPARTEQDIAAAAALFRAYADALGIDLGFQDFEGELAALPGKYAPPGGELLLARTEDGRAIGCVAFRPLEAESCCEMKRLYVAPDGRGMGLGRALVDAILAAAGRAGYAEMRLDTLASMSEALALYDRVGFVRIAPYYDTPLAGTVFLAKQL